MLIAPFLYFKLKYKSNKLKQTIPFYLHLNHFPIQHKNILLVIMYIHKTTTRSDS